jgi:hypothetical protein
MTPRVRVVECGLCDGTGAHVGGRCLTCGGTGRRVLVARRLQSVPPRRVSTLRQVVRGLVFLGMVTFSLAAWAGFVVLVLRLYRTVCGGA